MTPHPFSVAIDGRYVQAHFPGIGRYSYNLVAALAALDAPNLKLKIIYNPALPDTRHRLPELAANYPHKIELIRTAAKPISPGEQWQLWRATRQANLWHAPYYIKPYVLPIPTILTAYDLTARRVPGTLPSRRAKLAFEITTRLAFATARRIIVPSEATKRDIIELYRVQPQKIRVIYSGIEPKFAQAAPQTREKWRNELNLPASYILYVGINKPHKNLARLIAAFDIFRQRTASAAKLLIAGPQDTRYQPALQQQVEALRLGDAVVFYGEIAESDLPKFYNCAELCVLPSLYEGIGLPVLEAMACGVAVACADNSAMPEMAGNAALLFPASDTAAIAAMLERAMQNPTIRHELSAKSLQRAKFFSLQRAAEETLLVYEELL